VRIELTIVSLPLRDKECPFYAASLLSILSSRDCQSSLEGMVGFSGRPRYVKGKLLLLQWSMLETGPRPRMEAQVDIMMICWS